MGQRTVSLPRGPRQIERQFRESAEPSGHRSVARVGHAPARGKQADPPCGVVGREVAVGEVVQDFGGSVRHEPIMHEGTDRPDRPCGPGPAVRRTAVRKRSAPELTPWLGALAQDPDTRVRELIAQQHHNRTPAVLALLAADPEPCGPPRLPTRSPPSAGSPNRPPTRACTCLQDGRRSSAARATSVSTVG
ncbi:hypothetical protein GCM10010343_34050 [Streptomyces avidinii]|nr:hypothetical protein GCM10010343_34050 [Streptomyces avidinii]